MKPERQTGDSVGPPAPTVGCAPCCISCPLSELARGGCGRVLSLAGAPRLQRRLMALGLRPSAQVSVLGRAPGNGPLELRAGTVHLMLRACEADGVWVEVDDPASVRRPAPEEAYAPPTV